MPRLALNDGYTLDAATLAESDGATGLPVVAYRYRPALPDALAEWRFTINRAASGRAEVDATARLLADHLVSWDVRASDGADAPITPETIRRVPEPILNQFLRRVLEWAGPNQEQAAGN